MILTLVQCASGRFLPLQKAVAPHHEAYCQQWGYNYLVQYGTLHPLGPMWDKISLLRAALNFSDLAVWLDSDSLIVDVKAKLADAFNGIAHIGQCIHPESWNGKPHFNCGVGFYRSTPETKSFLDTVNAIGIVPHSRWQVQATMLTVNDLYHVMAEVDCRWNSTVDTNESPCPIIQSWHGQNQDFTPILKRLEEVRLA